MRFRERLRTAINQGLAHGTAAQPAAQTGVSKHNGNRLTGIDKKNQRIIINWNTEENWIEKEGREREREKNSAGCVSFSATKAVALFGIQYSIQEVENRSSIE